MAEKQLNGPHIGARFEQMGLVGRQQLKRKAMEWTGGPRDQVGCNLSVAGSRFQMSMTERNLDDADVDSTLQKVRCKGMAQRVGGHVFVNSSTLPCAPTGVLESASAEMIAWLLARKQP